MKLLREIFRQDGLNVEGKTIHRDAVRGIIIQQGKLLLIYSPKNGDYKFPGGGVDRDETYKNALIREIQEECGATVVHIEGVFGKVVEYDNAVEQEYEVFKMTSRYYVCHVNSEFNRQNLDDYEKALGFEPVWVDIDTAIQTNTAVINSSHRQTPRWTKRDTCVLELVKTELLPS